MPLDIEKIWRGSLWLREKRANVMNKLLVAAAIASCGIFTLTAQERPLGDAPTAARQNALAAFHTYCSGCHTGTAKSVSGPLLDKFDTERIREDPEVWARAYRHLQAGTMPPVGAKRPDRATSDAALEKPLRMLSPAIPSPM